ncbi:hypothetical protein B0H34DRAFT_722586 [Crassisporium funariophilum]|nr:hypothetical protein B0H34DRAFT_722586 [Crassisporium funariophilum]
MSITKRRKSSSFIVFLNDLLARSRDAPLCFYIYASSSYIDYESHPIIDALVPHSHRWEEATIECTYNTVNALHRIKGRIRRLRTLSLTLHVSVDPEDLSIDDPEDLVIDLFEEAPQLRQVSVVGLYTNHVALPWSQLTQYEEGTVNRGALNQVLMHAVDLKTLEIEAQASYYATVAVTTLPHLVSLSLKLWAIDADQIIDSLTLPAVRHIKIGPYHENLVPHLTALITRSPEPCLLQKLTYRTATSVSQDGELAKLLQLTPGLVELDIAMPSHFDLFDLVMLRLGGHVLLIHSSIEEITGKERTLRDIALSRCEKPTSRFGWDEDAGLGRRLRTFRLLFDDDESCFGAQSSLNGWINGWEHTSGEAQLLHSWREMLQTELHELEREEPSPKRALSFPRRLNRLLELIGKYEPGKVVNIYMSKLHLLLRQLGKLHPTDIPGDRKYHFRARADNILNQWAPLIRADLVNMRWALKGWRTLVYVPTDDGLRADPEVGMVYGLADEMKVGDLRWADQL